MLQRAVRAWIRWSDRGGAGGLDCLRGGRLCRLSWVLREGGEGDRGQVGAELGDRRVEEAADAFAAAGVDVGLAVVDEERFGGGDGEFFQDVAVDLWFGFHTADFGGKDWNVEVAQPGGVIAEMVCKGLVEIGEQSEFVPGGVEALDPIEHGVVEGEPHLNVPAFQVCERGGIEWSGEAGVLGESSPVFVGTEVAAIKCEPVLIVEPPECAVVDAENFGSAIEMRVRRHIAKHHAEIEDDCANRVRWIGSGGSHSARCSSRV